MYTSPPLPIVMAASMMLAVSVNAGETTDLLDEPVRYVCPPCYHVENLFETETYPHDGQCPVCGMNLIEKNTHQPPDVPALHGGSGNFLMNGRPADSGKTIRVFYHRPEGFNSDSPILLVIPGAGRNAWEYRDHWVESSERHDVLVLSPEFPETDYDFAAYHLGGVVTNLDISNAQVTRRPSKYRIKDEDIRFDVVPDAAQWTFHDLDRVFESAVLATGSKRDHYDVFGHSAGGQILHRMAIFLPNTKARRIIAANSGFYTLPLHDVPLPFGLQGSTILEQDLADGFVANLVLLIGEEDDVNETRGTMLHTPLVDRQGLGRLSRARYFFRMSQSRATRLSMPFNWQLEIVPGIGHDGRRMGEAAAAILYGDWNNWGQKKN